MANELQLSVYNAAEVARLFDRIKVFRADRKDGIYVEVTRPATRLPISANKTIYVYDDPTGLPTAFYRSTYFNSQSQLESSQSDPQKAGSDPALAILSVADLREKYLFGLQLTDRCGKALPDAIFETGIRAAVAWVERKLGLSLVPQVITAERHDYQSHLRRKYTLTYLDVLPIQSVQAMRLAWPGQGGVQAIPADWLRIKAFEGCVEVVPSSAGTTLAGTPLGLGVVGGLPWGGYGAGYVPDMITVDYTAGWPDNKLPADIVDLVAKAAALQPLAVAGDLIGPLGVSSQSVSIDGFGQSIGRTSNAQANAYGSRMSAYLAQLTADIPMIRTSYRSLAMRVA